MSGSACAETFGYDKLDRLVSYGLPLLALADSVPPQAEEFKDVYDTDLAADGMDITTGDESWKYAAPSGYRYEYGADGNIVSTTSLGAYTYSSARPHAVETVQNPYGRMSGGLQQVTYNIIGKVNEIEEEAEDGTVRQLAYEYGPDNQRWATVFLEDGEDRRHTYYGDSGERIYEDGSMREFHYLGGGLLHVSADGEDDAILYMHTDHQGSVTGIYDAGGNRLFAAGYDPWGNMTETLDALGFIRGYTGHEMLREFGLIDMNGRLYDPATGRFLSADRYIQLPDNSQSFNRYSYCLNNPLKYTDPSGEAFVVDDLFTIAAIGAIMGGGSAVMSGGNVWKGALVGALSSTASYGIGSLFGHAAGTFGHELLRAGAHGLSNGIIGAIDGHGFGSSFAGGFVSSFAGSGLQTLGVSSPLALSGGAALSGGLATMSLGGSFWDGVSIGSTVGAYNHGWRTDTQGRYYELDEVVCLGSREYYSYAGCAFGGASMMTSSWDDLRGNTRVGSNGKIYYRHPNKKIFQGNQYVSVRQLKELPHSKILGNTLTGLAEVPDVLYAGEAYGVFSREQMRAAAVASGRIAGGKTGSVIGEWVGSKVGAGLAGYFSGGTLVAPAYVCGSIIGNIGGGWLGSEIGGYAAGLMFDLTF